jgi:hypothetical protein
MTDTIESIVAAAMAGDDYARHRATLLGGETMTVVPIIFAGDLARALEISEDDVELARTKKLPFAQYWARNQYERKP